MRAGREALRAGRRGRGRTLGGRGEPSDIGLGARALDDGGDESRLEVDYPLGGLRDAEDKVLNEVGDAAVGDDEEAGDGAGHALSQVVALARFGAIARLAARRAR